MTTLGIIVTTALIVFLAMFILQNVNSAERKLNYKITPLAVDDPAFERAMAHLLGPPLVPGNRVDCLVNGDEIFPAMLAALRGASQSVTLETYIYWSGKIGAEFADVLADRAAAGVRVHVLLDWVGSDKLDDESIRTMREAGVEIERYRPLHWYNISRLNNRTHRKILVVDGRVGFIGGVGIAEQWLGQAQSPDNWRDTHFQIEGPAVAQLQAGFIDNWMKTRDEVLQDDRYFPALEPAGDTLAQVFKSSPREGSNSARLMFLMSIEAARQRILIATSYFVPDDRTVEALAAAARRGVAVEVLVPNRHTDMPLARRASRARWGPLLQAGVAIYEYQPTMYHCKVMVIDDRWTSVGSANIDNRSFRLNDEANLNMLDLDVAAEQVRLFAEDRERAQRITLEAWQNRPYREKIQEALAALFRSQL
jgi:cardiolipin synthase